MASDKVRQDPISRELFEWADKTASLSRKLVRELKRTIAESKQTQIDLKSR